MSRRRGGSLVSCLVLAAVGNGGCSATAVGSFQDPGADAALTDVAEEPIVDAPIEVVDAAPDVPDVPPDLGVQEDCATPFDDNGDGRANENCPCTPQGATQGCFERPGSQLQGLCRIGAQTCGSDGTWGVCVGSWLPDAAGRCELADRFNTDTRRPVDIVWFVDTSGSMDLETAAVNANLNRFATTMAASGLDYHVVMVARRGSGRLMVCVPPPLGGAGCSNSPRLLHVDQRVGSTDGLRQLLATHPQWRGFLRAGAERFVIAVTDDESNITADAFDAGIRVFPGWERYTFNSIVGYETRTDCPTFTRRGGVYLTLTERTMGERARVCDPDWSGTFTAFARGIASRVTTWPLSQRPRADTVQVWVSSAGGAERRLTEGWTYDPADNRISLDPGIIPAEGFTVRVVYRTPETSP